MNADEVKRRAVKIIFQMKEIIKQNDLEVLTPDTDPDFLNEISLDDFRKSVLNFPVLRITPDDVASLISTYKEGQFINFLRFINDVIAPDIPSLNTTINPTTGQIVSTSSLTESLTPKKKLPPQYEELARYLYHKKTNLRELMQGLDRQNTGKLSGDQFCRGLLDFPSAVVLARLEMDKQTKLVDYRQLQNKIDGIDLKFVAQEADVPIDEIPDIVKGFIQQVKSHGIILTDVFYKKSKTGFMEPQRFFTTLRTLKLNFTIDDYKAITQCFTKENKVDLKRFLRIAEHYSQEKYVPPPPPLDLDEETNNLLDMFNNRRLNVWSVFKPYDRTGQGIIPKQLFVNTLINLHLGISDRAIRAIADSIAIDDGKNINYVEFSKKVYAKRSMAFDETIDSVLQRLRDHVLEKNLRLAKALSIYDREKSGLITTSQFIAALRRIGFEVKEKDLALIREKYEDKAMPHYILWKQISEDVDIQQAQVPASDSNLQFSPSMREILSSSRTMTTYTSVKLTGSNPTENRPVPDNLIPLYGEIFRRMTDLGIDIGDELMRKDKLKKGRVPRAFFRETIGMLGLKVTQEVTQQLVDFYSIEETNEVYYMSFLKDVEEFGTLYAGGGEEEEAPEHEEHHEEEQPEQQPTMNRTLRENPPSEEIQQEFAPELTKLNEACKRARIDPTELFHDFDKTNSGIVPRANFARALLSSGVHMTQKDSDALADKFVDEARPDCINYLKLVTAINQAKVDQVTGSGFIPLSQPDEEKVKIALHKIVERLRSRRSNVRRLFANATSNPLPENDFIQCLSYARESVSNEVMHLILKKYRVSSDGSIDYEQFIKDCDQNSLLL